MFTQMNVETSFGLTKTKSNEGINIKTEKANYKDCKEKKAEK